MIIIPAIDLLGGKCVRLVQGDPTQSTVYYDHPLDAAQQLEAQGAELIHIVDLDAALGSGENIEPISEILSTIQAKIQVGGGIRNLPKAKMLLQLGVTRIIFGTAAIHNPELISEAVHRFGSAQVAVAIDEKYEKVTFHGWQEQSTINYLDLARIYDRMKVGAIIFTPTQLDGTLRGPHVEKTQSLVEAVDVPVIASGGVAELDDLRRVATTGVVGVIVGTALYEKRFTLEEAIEEVKNVS
jgi:phosphoribosylformimino-5-aminoimidazole carboxamide ribotide isomerase